ncbi:MAG: hypothetical protein AAGA25_16145, partial [Planctomycetota bacterium]
MVAAGLAAVARRSLDASLQATRFERETQRKWIVKSAETLLPELETFWETDSQSAPLITPITASINPGEIDLGHHRVRLVMADEQAKANLNAVWGRHDPAVVRAKLSELIASMGLQGPAEMRPVGSFESTAVGSESTWATFASFEQLVPPDVLQEQLRKDTHQGDQTLLDSVTLWGDGRLRADRSTPPALNMALAPMLSPSQIDEWISLQSESAANSDPLSFDQLELTDRQRELLAGLVTSTSNSYSVRVHMNDGRRHRTTMSVRTDDEEQDARLIRFRW